MEKKEYIIGLLESYFDLCDFSEDRSNFSGLKKGIMAKFNIVTNERITTLYCNFSKSFTGIGFSAKIDNNINIVMSDNESFYEFRRRLDTLITGLILTYAGNDITIKDMGD